MFERMRARRVESAQRRELAAWQQERDDAVHLFQLAQHVGSSPIATDGDLVLKDNEAVVGYVSNVGLIAQRSVGGHFEAGSRGISIPIGSLGGRSVRYHIGRSRGHYVAGTPTPTAVDHGTLFITDQRLVFVGSTSTKECRFDKLVSLHVSDDGEITAAVSGRTNSLVVHYGADAAAFVRYCVDFALARHHGRGDEFVAELASHVAEIDARRPAPR